MANREPPKPPGTFHDPLAGVKDEGLPLTPESSSMAVQFSEMFPYQSYLDDTLLEQAILVQPANTSIIFSDSKKATKALSGYGISVAPFSQVPLAIKLQSGGAKGGSNAYVVAPGTVWRPHGVYPGQARNAFSGIQVGLPAGFLGGGRATFALLSTPDAEVKWTSSPREILFHRQRYLVLDDGNALPAISKTPGSWYNWPVGFPSANVINSAARPQQGQSVGRIVGTRIEVRVRATMAGGERLYVVMRGTDDMDTQADGVTVSTTDVSYVQDIVFDASTHGVETSFGVREVVGGPLSREGGDFCRVDFISSDAALIGSHIDIFRYGILG